MVLWKGWSQHYHEGRMGSSAWLHECLQADGKGEQAACTSWRCAQTHVRVALTKQHGMPPSEHAHTCTNATMPTLVATSFWHSQKSGASSTLATQA